MWAIDNDTGFEAAGSWLIDESGGDSWVTAITCTFDVDPAGATTLADQQRPPTYGPAFRGDPTSSSLLHDTDFVLRKPGTDVLVEANAFAPDGRPTNRVEVEAAVGSLRKRLIVYGDRRWQAGFGGVKASGAARFRRMAIEYERSFGGGYGEGVERVTHPENPVGRGFAARPADLEGELLPNVEPPAGPRVTAGLGPIAAHWQPRLSLAGTYDDHWQQNVQPRPPADLDPAHYRCAPRDQWLPQHAEAPLPVALTNMTPTGRLSFHTPVAQLRVTVAQRTGDTELRPKLNTIFIDAKATQIVLTYHCVARADPERLIATRIRRAPS